jgi:transcriptional regulator with XRE-family HTH domain
MRGRIGAPLKVNQRMVHRIAELRAQRLTQDEIAAEVGISQGTVSVVLRAHKLGGRLPEARRRRWF